LGENLNTTKNKEISQEVNVDKIKYMGMLGNQIYDKVML